MSWRHAPLWVEAHDLARWVLERIERWPPEHGRHFGPLLARSVCELVEAVSLVLTFPATRLDDLRQADRAIVRLRSRLRLARDLALLSPGGLRFAEGKLRVIGRMVGGWQKKLRRRERGAESVDGVAAELGF